MTIFKTDVGGSFDTTIRGTDCTVEVVGYVPFRSAVTGGDPWHCSEAEGGYGDFRLYGINTRKRLYWLEGELTGADEDALMLKIYNHMEGI